MHMASSEPTMDILDGSDVDEDNVGDVDVDQENVLLESDEEESHPSHQHHLSRQMGGRSTEERSRNLEEEEDVLNIALQDDEEILDYGGDDNDEDGEGQRLPPVKVRSSFVNNVVREPSHLIEPDNDPSASCSNAGGGGALVDDNFGEREYAEDDDYEDGDEETETRTRSRFTTERNVESRGSGGGGGHSGSTSTIQTIQTLGEHKVKPNVSDGRPRHWNHNNGPRQGGPLRPNGPRHPGGRNHRFPPPRHGPPGENPHMRMLNPPVVQFSEGLFTDFNQPIRHPHQGPRPRQPPPGPPQHPPRNSDQNVHRHPIQPPNSMNSNIRPNFPPQMPQQPRPFFPSPQENQMRHPPRMQPPGPPGHISHQHPQQHPPLRPPPPDFNMHGQRPPRFPPNNMHPNQRHARPPNNNMNNQPHMQRPDRPPFPPRHQRPQFRPDMPPQDPMGMPPHRYPHQQGFPPQPPHGGGGPPGFMPQHPQHPPRFMGPHGGGPPPPPPEGLHNSYYMQQQGGPGNFNNHPPVPGEQAPYPPEAPWHNQSEHLQHPGPGAPPNPNHTSHWSHQPQHQHPPHHQQQQPPPHQQPNYSGIGGPYGNPNTMYEQQPLQRPPLSHHNPILGQQAALTIASLQNAHSVDLPPITNKSIYINPNSEIHEALSKGGHFRHLKEEERRHEGSSSGSISRPSHGSSGVSNSAGTSSKHYDDYDHDHHHYHDRDSRDRERSSSSRRPSSPDRRRDRDRDEDDYYDDRRKSSYHHYDERDRDRRQRRKYEEDSRDRRHRSDSPEKKMSRSDNYDRDRDRDRRDRDPVQNKESDKLLEEAKQLGLDEDYVKRLEEQRKLRERILKTKEQRRKQVKVPGTPDTPLDKSSSKTLSSLQKCVENEADSTVATAKSGSNSGGGGAPIITGKTKKVLRIVKDKSGKVISKKVHVVVVGKHQDGPQSTATS